MNPTHAPRARHNSDIKFDFPFLSLPNINDFASLRTSGDSSADPIRRERRATSRVAYTKGTRIKQLSLSTKDDIYKTNANNGQISTECHAVIRET